MFIYEAVILRGAQARKRDRVDEALLPPSHTGEKEAFLAIYR
jgi:hypothetical protein